MSEEEKEVLVEETLQEEDLELPPPYNSVAPADIEHRTPFYRHWYYATIVLCCYGFFKEFKPSEPFLTPYLEDYKNFTKSQVNSQVYPFWPYSYLVAAFFTFILTDAVRYKPVILLESGAYLATRFLLVWGTSLVAMQWMQVVYGVATATEIAYFSYIYAAVSVVHFKKVTSYVRAVRLFGQSVAGIVGQILISTKVFNILQLNYISLASVSVACVFSVLLPSVYDCGWCDVCTPGARRRDRERVNCNSYQEWFQKAVMSRIRDFVKFYSVLSLLKWSIWWALAMCGVLQVGNYVQSLWKEVAGANAEYNGVVEALATLCAAGSAFVLSLLKVNWPVWGELTIGVLSLLDSIVLLLASSASQLWGVYLAHIVYRSSYSFLITIASAQLALKVDHESYALIFGFNTFIALVLQTILTLVVADEHGLNLPIRTQFVVYSGYYFVLTLIFVGAGVYKLTSVGWLHSFKVCWQEPPPAARRQPAEQREVDEAAPDIQARGSNEPMDKLV